MARLLFLQDLEYEYVGPAYLSAMLKKHGHQCRMAIGRSIGDFDTVLRDYQPDLVAFSIMTGSHRWAIRMAKDIRHTHGIRNIFGGPHATFCPDFIEGNGIDMVVRGEGEHALLEVMEAIDGKGTLEDVQNLWVKGTDGRITRNPLRPLVEDLDGIPSPDIHLYDSINNRVDRTVRLAITTRGCPYRCSFCMQGAMRELYKGKGKFIRTRSVDHVIEELRRVKNEVPVRRFYIRDDCFGLNRKWLYEFLEKYEREIGIDFMCLVRADLVASEPGYAARLAAAGCRLVFMGVESGNEQLRNLVLEKRLTNDEIVRAADYLHRAGIPFLTFNILGLPNETLEDAFSTVQLNIAIKTDYPWCSLYFPLPGTKLTNYAIEKGLLSEEYRSMNTDVTFYRASGLKDAQAREIANLQCLFQTVVLWPWTLPIVRRLVQFQAGPVYKLWFALIYFYVHVKSEGRSFWKSFTFAARNYRHLIGSKLSKSSKTVEEMEANPRPSEAPDGRLARRRDASP